MSLLEKIDRLRKAPQSVKEHLVAVVAITVTAVITVIWFLFSINSFLKNGIPQSAIPTAGESQTQATSTSIAPPFGL